MISRDLKPMGKLNIMALWIHSYFKVLSLKQGFEVEPLSAVKCPPGDLVRGYKYEKKLGRANRSCISAKPVPEDIGFSALEAPYQHPSLETTNLKEFDREHQ